MSRENKSHKRRGRPSKDYDEHIAERICLYISTTSYSLKKICKKHKSFPRPTTVYRWILQNDGFAKMYGKAKELQTQLLADQLVELADKVRIGETVTSDRRGKQIRRGDMVQRTHLQIDVRKWILAKLVPHKYGDKLLVDTGQNNLPELLASFEKRNKKLGPPEGWVPPKKKKDEDED